jgi:hypothetical protein
MEHDKKRLNAMLLALCMVLTAFVAVVSVPVGADEDPGPGSDDQADLEALWNNVYMENDPALGAVDEPIIFNYDGGNMYLLGDDDDAVIITIDNTGVDNLDNVVATLGSGSGVVTIDDGTDSPPGIWNSLTTETFNFLIDIGNSADVETTYPLTLNIDYDIGASSYQDTFNFDIFISSRFDDASGGTERDEHDDLPNILENLAIDADVEFEYGVDMQEGLVTLTNYGPDSIWDITTTISGMASEIDLKNNDATDPGPIGAGNPFTVRYRLDVPLNNANPTDPGYYGGDMEIVYSRTVAGIDKVITENPRSIELTVDFTPRLTASGTTEINQWDTEATWDVTFTNEGNVELTTLVISASPDGDWFDVTMHHYENDDATFMPEVDIGTLAAGATSSAVSVRVAPNMWVPDGIHRIPFDWNGWYNDDSSTGNPSEWIEVGGVMYDHDSGPNSEDTPEVGLLYRDADESGDLSPGDGILEGMWDGAFTDITVNDTNGLSFSAVLIGNIDASDKVTNRQLEVEIYNSELVDYTDIFVEMGVGPGTPFLVPGNPTATRVGMDLDLSDDEIDDQDDATVYFYVDVNAAWWQTDSVAPDTYMITIYVDATNDDTEERFEDEDFNVAMEIVGFGPELFASIVSHTSIKPGNTFDLTIEITNFGDDTAREVDAYLRADFVAGWTILDQFVTSIGAYGGEGFGSVGDASHGWSTDWMTYESFNKTHDVRPGEIGVDNVPQIVELYDWIKRRETPPQGKILWIHLDRLEPGTTHSFQFEMVSDVNMVEGMVYYEVLELEFVDSQGETYGPDPFGMMYDNYAPPQEVLIRAGKGEKYETDELDFSVLLYAIIFLIIAFIVFLIGYALGGRGGKEKAEPAGFDDYEQEYMPPPEPEDDLGPPPAPEEDLGPPMPEEKPPE